MISLISKKKQKFRSQIRAEHLKKYMDKVRLELKDSQQYHSLKKVLHQSFTQQHSNSNEFQQNIFAKERRENKKNISHSYSCQKLKNLAQLIKYANFGYTSAIIEISDLILKRKVNLEMIRQIGLNSSFYGINNANSQNAQNCQNINKNWSNNYQKTNSTQIMQIIKFPSSENEGWLIFINALILVSQYCTEQMVLYCLKTISTSLSMQAVHFSLYNIFLILSQKKRMKIQQIVRIIVANYNVQKLRNESDKSINFRPENFFYSLMKYSLGSSWFSQNKDIQFFSTTILCKCFSSHQIMSEVFLNLIPLSEIGYYLTQKFQIKDSKKWNKRKSLAMISQLLTSLQICKLYDSKFVINSLILCFKSIMTEIRYSFKGISLNVLTQSRSNRMLENTCIEINNCQQSAQMKFLEESIYFIEVLIEKYLFVHSNIQILSKMLRQFKFQNIFISFYEAYFSKVQKIKKNAEIRSHQNQQMEILAYEQMCLLMLFQQVGQILVKFISNLTECKFNIDKQWILFQSNEANLSAQQMKQNFLVISGGILSQLRRSDYTRQFLIKCMKKDGKESQQIQI